MSKSAKDPYIDEVAKEALEVLVSSLEERLRGPFSQAVNDGLDRVRLEETLGELKSSLGTLVTPRELRQRSEEIVDKLEKICQLFSRKEQVESLDQQVKELDRKITEDVDTLKVQNETMRQKMAAYSEKNDRQMDKVQGALALVLNELALMQRAEAAIINTLNKFLGTSKQEDAGNEV